MAERQLKVLITGASGFIGSFLCEEGLRRGLQVWAGVRATSSRRWLQSEWLNVQVLDLDDPQVLGRQLAQYKAQNGRWDFVIHAAGATKCRDAEDFDRVNYEGTVHLVEQLRALDMVPQLFVYLSSLSVLGPLREPEDGYSDYPPLPRSETPQPNTAYGRSKARAEQYLQELGEEFPHVIFRPTGVYGPRERDYFLMAKSIARHVDFSVGRLPQRITFVYVRDVAGAVFAAVDRCLDGGADYVVGRTYHVSDGSVYDSRTFSDLLQRQLGVRHVLHMRAPLWMLRVVCAVSEWWAGLWGRTSTLNADKYRILRQRNWNCDIVPLKEELGYTPQWTLAEGVEETVAWYIANKWL